MILFHRKYQPNKLVAKQNAKGLILIAIFPVIGLLIIALNYNESKAWYRENPFGFIFLCSVLLALTIFFFYKIFDRSIKLIISEKGIWAKKFNLIPWEKIDAYHFEKRLGKSVTVIFFIEFNTIGESLTLDITFLDKDWEEIRKAVEEHSNRFNIRYAGITEINS